MQSRNSVVFRYEGPTVRISFSAAGESASTVIAGQGKTFVLSIELETRMPSPRPKPGEYCRRT